MQLRQYQTDAAVALVAILQQHRVAYLRGEVRVGKTLTVLDALKRLGAALLPHRYQEKGNPIHRSGS
jgi:superfamily II DNA or RNA helicase